MLILYSLGLFIAPVALSSFWPWKIDVFHGQLYSGAFAASGVGGILISRRAAHSELLAQGLSQIAFGFFAMAGLLLVNSTLQRVNWSAFGAWLWIAGFILISGTGIGLLWHGRQPSYPE